MIRIGPAGSRGLGNLEGVREVARMKLDCMEVEFTYGVRLTLEDARQVGELARRKRIVLSVHAPYYINLASNDTEKIAASKQRIVDCCQRAAVLGAKSVVFHAGFYQGKSADQTYEMVKRAVLDLQRRIRRRKWSVQLCPETSGKPSQFGSLQEIVRLMQETGCGITVDFAHLYARQQGVIDYGSLLDQLPRIFHAHFSGIEYGSRGEIRHVVTLETFFEPLAAELIKRRLDVNLINESPQPYEDAVMMKAVVRRMKQRRLHAG
jgi:deoxyribonuclease-4